MGESEEFTLCHREVRKYRGNLEESSVYTQMEKKIIPTEPSKKKNQQLMKREVQFCVQREFMINWAGVFLF